MYTCTYVYVYILVEDVQANSRDQYRLSAVRKGRSKYMFCPSKKRSRSSVAQAAPFMEKTLLILSKELRNLKA